jgi:WD40 repeat protein
MKTGGTLDIWDVSSLNSVRKKEAQKWGRTSPFPLLATLEGHSDEITDVALSSDGKTLASSSKDKTVKLWSLSTNQLLLSLDTGDSPVITLAYSGDNQILLGGDTNGRVKLWRAPRVGEKTALNTISLGHP